MLGLSLAYRVDVELVTGLTILAVLVLLRSMIVRRRISSTDQDGIIEGIGRRTGVAAGNTRQRLVRRIRKAVSAPGVPHFPHAQGPAQVFVLRGVLSHLGRQRQQTVHVAQA